MKWYRGSPTTPGWYWYRPHDWRERNRQKPYTYPTIVRLHGQGGELYTQTGFAVPDLAPCEWAGPIPEPKEGVG